MSGRWLDRMTCQVGRAQLSGCREVTPTALWQALDAARRLPRALARMAIMKLNRQDAKKAHKGATA